MLCMYLVCITFYHGKANLEVLAVFMWKFNKSSQSTRDWFCRRVSDLPHIFAVNCRKAISTKLSCFEARHIARGCLTPLGVDTRRIARRLGRRLPSGVSSESSFIAFRCFERPLHRSILQTHLRWRSVCIHGRRTRIDIGNVILAPRNHTLRRIRSRQQHNIRSRTKFQKFNWSKFLATVPYEIQRT